MFKDFKAHKPKMNVRKSMDAKPECCGRTTRSYSSVMGGIEKAATVLGLIFVCAGMIMIARPYEAAVPNNSVTTPYSGPSGELHVTAQGMRITGMVLSCVGCGFIVAARSGKKHAHR
jgi:hypothetical protein